MDPVRKTRPRRAAGRAGPSKRVGEGEKRHADDEAHARRGREAQVLRNAGAACSRSLDIRPLDIRPLDIRQRAGRKGAAIAATLVLALGVDTPAAADVLVSNIGQTTETPSGPTAEADFIVSNSLHRATQFITGANVTGYSLSGITVDIADAGSSGVPAFALHANSTSNRPGRKVVDLGGSVSTTGAQSFTPASATTLAAGTTYWVVAAITSADPSTYINVLYTTSSSANYGAALGWRIGRGMASLDSGANWQQTTPRIQFEVNGTANATTNSPATGKPTISGTARGGETLTAGKGTIADTDGVPETLSYQWVRVDGGDALNIPGANASTYTLTLADQGKKVRVAVSFTDDAGHAESRTSDAWPSSGNVAARVNSPATGNPAILGTAREGATLTVALGTVADADGMPRCNLADPYSCHCSVFSYQWIRVDGEDETDIPDATLPTYTPVAADVGKKVKVRMSFTDHFDFAESPTSAAWPATGTVVANAPATGAPTIAGNLRVGSTLTATLGTVADSDGVPDDTGALTWQWLRVDGGNEADIANATSRSYTLGPADLGKKVKVRLSFTDDEGSAESRKSDAWPSTSIAEGLAPGLVGNLGQRRLSGGTTLDGVHLAQSFTTGGREGGYTLSGVALMLATQGSPTVPTVKIRRGSANGTEVARLTGPSSLDANTAKPYTFRASGIVTLSPATTYWVVAEGGSRRVRWSRTSSDGEDAYRSAGWSIAYFGEWRPAGNTGRRFNVISRRPYMLRVNGMLRATSLVVDSGTNSPATGKPTVSGPARVGKTLAATPGTIADPDGMPDAAGAFTYQWIRVDDGNETDITDATSPTYTLVPADQGKNVKVEVSFTDTGGSEESRESDAWPSSGTVAARVSTGTDCAAPTLAGRTIVWTNTVDVADTTGSGSAYGFSTADSPGSLTDGANTRFDDEASGSRTVMGVEVDTSHGLSLQLSGGSLPQGERGRLKLHVCDDGFDFSAASVSSAGSGTLYAWASTGLDWSSESTRTVYISRNEVPAPATNFVATGKPTIGGTAQVGETLTAAKGTITDPEGVPSTFAYQWIRVDGASETDIRGATSSTYTLVADDEGKKVKVRVSFDDNDGHPESLESDAWPSSGTVVAQPPGGQNAEPSGPTARFEGLQDDHDGSTPIAFELHFSEEPEDLSYRTVGGALLVVTGATITGARRLTPHDNTSWEVKAQPSGNADIVITLPNRACDEANAVCVGGAPLAAEVSATIPREVEEEQIEQPAPFTASFAGNVPSEHDGAASTKFEFEFHLSHDPGHLSYVTVRDDLFTVTGGAIENAWRRTRGDEKHMHWNLRVDPSGDGDVTIALNATADCAGTPGVCRLSDGAMLASYLQLVIKGPATLSVADATVQEADGATLDFVVTLSRQRSSTTTVAYATSDGTATAGSDYTETSGTLTFTALRTSQTVSVPVRNDAHNEGSEAMTLTLSNPTPSAYVRLSDASATGTITNTDPMPEAWAMRFGRTVGSQVVDALTDRLANGGGTHVTVGGIQLTGDAAEEPRAEAQDPLALPTWTQAQLEEQARTMTGQDLLLGTSFRLSGAGAENATGPTFTAWGHVAQAGFEAREDDVTLDGDVTTGLVGFDAEWERALAGVMISQSKGDGGYELDDEMGEDGGRVESDMTGVYPYARLDLDARVSAWAVAGAGSGEITLEREDRKPMPADLTMRMGALGVKGRVMDGTGPSGVGLDVRSDALWVRTKTSRTSDMIGTDGDVTRLRVIVRGERVSTSESGARFTPSAEVGLRHDGGDAETGAGMEVGVGARYTSGALTVEGRVRGLVAHEATGYEEWGASGSVQVAPGQDGRGLTLSITPAWGNTGSASERLWSARDARGLGAGGEFEGAGRIEMEAGYGFGFGPARSTLTPYAGATFGEGASRTMRTGARWQLGPDAVLALEGTRQGSGDESSSELRLRAALRF